MVCDYCSEDKLEEEFYDDRCVKCANSQVTTNPPPLLKGGEIMIYKIANNEELDTFIWECTQNGGTAIAIKGPPPSDATYSDGDPIINDWNIAWMDSVTKERCEIIYVPDCESYITSKPL